MRRTIQLVGVGASVLLTACLAQAVPFVPPWCPSQDMQRAAFSADERWILSSDQSPHTLVLFKPALEVVQRYKATTLDGESHSRVGAVYDAPQRRSFIVTLPDIAELWEISYDPKAEPIYDGLVHDYRMGEGLARPGYLGVRRTKLATPLTDLYLARDGRHVIGLFTATADRAHLHAHVINLDIRREIAVVTLAAPADPAADLVLTHAGTTWRAEPGARQKVVMGAGLARYCTP